MHEREHSQKRKSSGDHSKREWIKAEYDVGTRSEILRHVEEDVARNGGCHLVRKPELRDEEVEPPAASEHECKSLRPGLSVAFQVVLEPVDVVAKRPRE